MIGRHCVRVLYGEIRRLYIVYALCVYMCLLQCERDQHSLAVFFAVYSIGLASHIKINDVAKNK